MKLSKVKLLNISWIAKAGLKKQFISVFISLFLVSGILILLVVYSTLNNKTEKVGRDFAVEYALKEKHRIMAPIKREIALSKKMANSPLLIEWAKNEEDAGLKERALNELESFREVYADKRYFFVIGESGNYYFNNKLDQYGNKQLLYTLDRKNSDDSWYFSSIELVDDFALNVDDNEVLGETNIWINTIVKDKEGNKLGIGGTGLNLNSYLEAFMHNNDNNITPIIFNSSGAVQAYQDLELIDKNSVAKDQSSQNTIFNMLGNQADIENLKSVMAQVKTSNLSVQTVDLTFNQQDHIAAITYLPEIDWYVTTLFQLSKIYSVWDYSNIIIIIIITLMLLIILTIYYTNQKVLSPLEELHRSTRQIAVGNYDYKLDINYENEFGQLAESFNEMADKVSLYTDNLEQLVREKTEKLRTANEVLAEKNQKITDSILYAQNILNSIIPEDRHLQNSLEDFFVIWQSRDIVGGDFYWYKEVEDGFLLALIDCTGHGVPGALMAMTTNTILQRIIDNHPDLYPASILSRLNKLLKEVLYKDESRAEIDDGLDIGLCLIKKSQKQCIYAGAKISLFYTEDGASDEDIEVSQNMANLDNTVTRIKGDSQSIGYRRSSESFTYTNHIIDIKQGMKFYMTTDGFLDQNGVDNKRFGLKRFIELIKDYRDLSLSEQGVYFKERLLEHMQTEEQRDDITVLGFCPEIFYRR